MIPGEAILNCRATVSEQLATAQGGRGGEWRVVVEVEVKGGAGKGNVEITSQVIIDNQTPATC